MSLKQNFFQNPREGLGRVEKNKDDSGETSTSFPILYKW